MRHTLLGVFDQVLRPQTEDGANWSDPAVWQSVEDLHRQPGFSALFGYIDGALSSYMDVHEYAYDSAPVVSAWTNVFQRWLSIDYQYRPNSYISRVYYVFAQRCPITFAHTKQHWILPPGKKINALNTPSAVIIEDDETLLLFPSYVYHCTNPLPTGFHVSRSRSVCS